MCWSITQAGINCEDCYVRIFIRTSKTGEIQHYINTYYLLGRKTETNKGLQNAYCWIISIHSVARPRHMYPAAIMQQPIFQSTRSQDRDTDTTSCQSIISISIHSVARPRRKGSLGSQYSLCISIHSVARPRPGSRLLIDIPCTISIHSVARPRPVIRLLGCPRVNNFNPLGRKTETQA